MGVVVRLTRPASKVGVVNLSPLPLYNIVNNININKYFKDITKIIIELHWLDST